MKLLLAFIFASFGTAFLSGDTLGCEKNQQGEKASVCVSEPDSKCNLNTQKRVIPTRL
ncbi:MAG: hypothetical protein V3R64_04625 [Sphingomonadales bacterium]